jgi:hypothetical protein
MSMFERVGIKPVSSLPGSTAVTSA